MSNYKIALYPGDGIGLDVVAEVAKVLRAAASRFGFTLEMTEFNWGHRYWRETGKVAPDDFLDTLHAFDAIYLGAVGDPAHLPDHITLTPLISLLLVVLACPYLIYSILLLCAYFHRHRRPGHYRH